MAKAVDLLKKRYLDNIQDKPESYIGVELEFPIVNLSHQATDITVTKSVMFHLKESLFFEVERYDQDGCPVQLIDRKSEDRILFEVSYNTIEFAFGKAKKIQDIEERFNQYMKVIQAFLKPYNHAIQGFGVHPYWYLNDNRAVKLPRYQMLLNFLALMGWSFGENKEIFTIEEMIENFSFDKISLGGPVFDLVKLGWVNNHHMRLKDLDELTKLAIPYFVKAGYYADENLSDKDYKKLRRIVEITREGSHTLKELPMNSSIYFEDEFELPVIEEGMNSKARKSVKKLRDSLETETGKKAIALFIEKINTLNEEISEDEAKQVLHELQDEIGEGPGAVLMPLRAVVTGKARGADLYTVIAAIGKERTLKRVQNTLEKIK